MLPLNELLTLHPFEYSSALPETIGPYTLAERLNQNAIVRVYRAFHEGYARDVRLEVIDRTQIQAQHNAAAENAGAWFRIRHPHLLCPIDVGEHGDFLYLAFERIPGSSLAAGLKKSRKRGVILPSSQILMVSSAIGGALTYLHARGRVHGSLSPAAIFIGLDGTWMLGNLETCFLDLPTPSPYDAIEYYHPPERERSRANDVYAFAVILAEMLLNLPPRIAIRTVVDSHYLNTPGLHIFPEDLIDALKQALHPDPAMLTQDVGVLMDALQCALHAYRRR
ncbi:MAG: protein kinase [Anaerolineales bacterium]|nr:protein kinase [Anaerolineales bacterium]